MDANDNSPQFESSSYEAEVYENEAAGSTVVRLHATDRDEGLNAAIVYRFTEQTMTSHGRLFAINNTTGEVCSEDQRLVGNDEVLIPIDFTKMTWLSAKS